MKTIVLISESKYFSLLHIQDEFISNQNFEEYVVEDKDEQGKKISLGEKYGNVVLRPDSSGNYEEFDLTKHHYPYYDSETKSVKYDEDRYTKEMSKYSEDNLKRSEMQQLEEYFSWFNSQTIQKMAGSISEEEYSALLPEYKSNSLKMKNLKNELGIKTETQLREEKEAK